MSDRPTGDVLDQQLRSAMQDLVEQAPLLPEPEDLNWPPDSSLRTRSGDEVASYVGEDHHATVSRSRPDSRGVLIAVAATVLVIVGVLIVADGDSDVVTDPTQPPEPAQTSSEDELLALGDRFVVAYYSFEPSAILGPMTSDADTDHLLKHQAFHDTANAVVVDHECVASEAFRGELLRCEVTHEDDIVRALGRAVTVGFTLSMVEATITDVGVSQPNSVDQALFRDLANWMRDNGYQPSSGPCERSVRPGAPGFHYETPRRCAEEWVAGAVAFAGSPESSAYCLDSMFGVCDR